MRGRAAGLLVIVVAGVLASESHAAMHVVVCFSPLILLLASLLAGRYPGADLLCRAHDRRRRTPSDRLRRAPDSAVPIRTRAERLPRGGLIVACALAGRGPPATGLPRTNFPL